jgi:tetratricopeptide (TPR) repeat protein
VLQTPSRIAALLLILGLAAAAAAADPPAKPPTKEQIAELVKALGSDSFEEREKASKALWKAGQAAETALRQVLKDGDPEAIRRAREILEKFDWGLYPETPEAVANLIERYRSGTPEDQAAVVPKLLEHGSSGFTALMKIAAAEKSPEAKALIWQLLAADMPRLAGALLAEGQDARLEEILEQALTGEGDQPSANYAAYLMVRGKLDEKIRALEKKAAGSSKPGDKTDLTLAYLYRAKGDLVGARKYAERAEHPPLLQTILIEQEDWKALLKSLDSPAAAPPGGFLAPPVGPAPHGLRVACLRLMGDRQRFEAELAKLAADPNSGVALPVFLLNGRPDDALTWLTKNNQHASAAELLAARQRFRQALEMTDKPAAADKGGDPMTPRLFKAGLLARLGERKQARELFDKLVAAIKPEEGGPGGLLTVLIAEYNAGFKDEAFARAATLMGNADGEGDSGILDLLFQPAGVEASVRPWWTFLRRKFPKDDAAATLKRMRDLLGRKMPARDAAALIKELANDAAKKPQNSPGPAPAPARDGLPELDTAESWLHCVVETCRVLGRDDLVEGYLEKWAAAGGDARAWLRLGDVAADGKRWKEAAERYRRAGEKDRSNALPLYLHGRALVQAGQEKEGRRWMEVAEALPLGSETHLANFALQLGERGLDEAAGKAWERLGRLSLLSSVYDGYVARALAEKAVAAKDYLKAANYYRREALHDLWEPSFDDLETNLWLAAAEHRYRARGLAAAGRFDEMRKEIKALLDLDPGHIDLCIDVVSELTKRGQKKEADELFARIYPVQEAMCKEFPTSAWSHNNTAWLAVRCKRDLDAALEHASKGVELDPDNSGHLDTLAEVYFQRGDKDKAIELMKKCIEMQPKYEYFRKQLKRMQAGDRDADVPPEPASNSTLRALLAMP